MLNTSDIVEHMEVVGSDGAHVGTVDHLAVKLTKRDESAGGEHHIIPFDLVGSVKDGKLMLNCTAGEARGDQSEVAG